MNDNSESLEIIDTVRRKMDRAIIEHGRSLRAMHEMHMGPFDQALFVDTAIGEIDRLTTERDAAREELAKLRAGIMELKRVNDKNIEWCRNQLPRPTAMEVDEVEAILRTHEWFGSCIRATLETGDTDVR